MNKYLQCVDHSLPQVDDGLYMHTSDENPYKWQSIENSACRILLLDDHESHIHDMHKRCIIDVSM